MQELPPSNTSQEPPMEDTMHRRQTTSKKQADSNEDNMRSPEDTRSMSKILNRFKVMVTLNPMRLVLFFFVMLLLVALPYGATPPTKNGAETSSTKSAATTATTTKQNVVKKKATPRTKPPPVDHAKYENCTLSTPASRGEWTTKPLWFPSYPAAIEDNLIKGLISKLTGLSAGAKSFYASSKRMGLRQCYGKTETAACMLVHPMIEMKPGPEGKTSTFASPLIYLMRNPLTNFPAFLNSKRIKYAKLPGQQPINEWRAQRDPVLPGPLWEGYKAQYLKWFSYASDIEHYKDGLYLTHEHLMDEQKGPQVIEQLASILSEAGFPTVPKEQMSCVWYQTIGKEGLDHYYKYGYDFDDYMPSVTEMQQTYLMKELATWIEESKDKNPTLAAILQEYHDTIESDITPDIPWVNETKATS